MLKVISHKNHKLEEINNLYKVTQDSMITYRNNLGQQVAKSSVLETQKQSYFLLLQTRDQQTKQLQELLKSETKKRHDIEVAVVFKDKTISKLKDSIQNKIIGYTKDSVLLYPIYEKIISNQWMDQKIKLGRNAFEQDLTIYNSYSVVIGSEKNGWFKRNQFSEITNLNPNSETTSMKVYQKKPIQSKFWTGLKYGGAGLVLGVLIKSL